MNEQVIGKDTVPYKENAVYRPCGRKDVRAVYTPSVSETLPWLIFIKGTAVMRRGCLGAVKLYLKKRGIWCDDKPAVNP